MSSLNSADMSQKPVCLSARAVVLNGKHLTPHRRKVPRVDASETLESGFTGQGTGRRGWALTDVIVAVPLTD